VQPLVEQAWGAADTDAVIEISRKLMTLLGLEEDAPEDPVLANLGARGPYEAIEEADENEEGKGNGTGAGPQQPHDDTEAFAELDERLELARPLAAQLEHILKAPRPKSRELSRSRGRLNVRRVIRHEERPFEKRPAGQEKPLRIFLAQDISGSMGYFVPEHPHYHALLTALALELSCARLKVPFELIAFDDDARIERPFGMEREEALLKVGSLASAGGTTLSAALELLAKQTRPDDLVFILCDGQLAEGDVVKSRRLAHSTAGILIPILIGKSASLEQFERVFGRTYSAASAHEIPAVIKRVLLATRAGAS
jgi:hypothetical protein